MKKVLAVLAVAMVAGAVFAQGIVNETFGRLDGNEVHAQVVKVKGVAVPTNVTISAVAPVTNVTIASSAPVTNVTIALQTVSLTDTNGVTALAVTNATLTLQRGTAAALTVQTGAAPTVTVQR